MSILSDATTIAFASDMEINGMSTSAISTVMILHTKYFLSMCNAFTFHSSFLSYFEIHAICKWSVTLMYYIYSHVRALHFSYILHTHLSIIYPYAIVALFLKHDSHKK